MKKIIFIIISLCCISVCGAALAANSVRYTVDPNEEPEVMQTVNPGDSCEMSLSESILVMGSPYGFYGLMYTGQSPDTLTFMTFNPNQGYLYLDHIPFMITRYDETFRIFGCEFRILSINTKTVKLIRME